MKGQDVDIVIEIEFVRYELGIYYLIQRNFDANLELLLENGKLCKNF